MAAARARSRPSCQASTLYFILNMTISCTIGFTVRATARRSSQEATNP